VLDVLESINTHGAYLTPQKIEEALTDPDTIIQLATTLKEERARRAALEEQAKADRPKVLFADAVSVSETTILIRDFAKLLHQNGVSMGEKRLFAWLRENGYLITQWGTSRNTPTQRSMELGLFVIKEGTYQHPDKGPQITKVTRMTGKGQTYFMEKFLAQRPPVQGAPLASFTQGRPAEARQGGAA
jgi:anti-repressor protein